MSDTTLLAIAASLVAAMFGLLCAILGWLGNRIYNKVDEMAKNLTTMAGELHTRINSIDTRVVAVETKLDMGVHCSTNPGFKVP